MKATMPRTADRTLTAKEKRFYFYLTTWRRMRLTFYLH
jgi:hypothetical protein